MFLPRLLIFGIPLAAGAVAWWSAGQARRGRMEERTHVVALLPQQEVTWNPYQRMSEGERQILDVVHEPLLRIDREGRLSPALSRRWAWKQRVHCWFSEPKTARVAAERLSALRGNQWVPWKLESAVAAGVGLTMVFSEVDGVGAEEAMKTIDDLAPEMAKVIQVSLTKRGREVLAAFRKTEQGRQLKRQWWDDDENGEILILGDAKAWGDALVAAFREAKVTLPELRLVGELKGLREPVLEFELKDGVRWHSGDRVTTADVKATIEQVKRRKWAIARERGFQDLQSVELDAEGLVRVVYRNFYGPALTEWVHLPILPQSWLAEHVDDSDSVAFSTDPPPGAGPFQLTRLDDRVLALSAVPRDDVEPLQRQVRILTGAGPFVMHMAFATGGADVAWPGADDMEPLLADENLAIRAAPARGRLMVLWNTRAPLIGDERLREALALGTDRQSLVDGLLDGRGRIHEGLYRPGLWYARDLPVTPFDLGQAQRKMASAGWLVDVSGQAKKPETALEFSLITTAGSPQREKLAELLSAQWGRLGATVRVEALPTDEWAMERLPSGRFDGVILGMDYAISWDQSSLWHSAELAPAGLNFSGVQDGKIDLLLDALSAEFDPDRVPERAGKLEDLILARRAVLPLFADRQDMIVRARLLPEALAEDQALDCTLRDLLLPLRETEVNPERLKMRVSEPDLPEISKPKLNMRVREDDAP